MSLPDYYLPANYSDYSQCIPQTAKYWFSFGDSYTQTGFVPNGTLPAIGNPLGNPPYPGLTATPGANWVDFVTTTYNNSLVFTYNYAYGGATIDATLVQPYTPTVLSLTDQVNEFLNTVATKPATTSWKSSDTLFSVWIGINDIGHSYYLSGDRNAFSDILLNAYFALVQKLLFSLFSNTGARNFLFINVPPVNRSPLMLAQPASAQATEKAVISDYNSKLAVRVAAFKQNNRDVNTWLWDSNAAFTQVLNNPMKYGFKDATTYGTGPGIFWGNNYHPSSAAHKIFGQKIGQLLHNTVW
ncbi:hypothetical protein L208DRAFT_1317043 [Tricholoma matsutake]|nr:hypothetical protein L208DRAFT_1317043 [Tricholoma matsutake 945]